MTFDSGDGTARQRLVRAHVWATLGHAPGLIDGPLLVQEPIWHSRDWETTPAVVDPGDVFGCGDGEHCEPVGLADVAARSVALAWSFYGDAHSGGGSWFDAHELGDGYWYVTQTEDVGEHRSWLLAVVPEEDAPAFFSALRLDWLRHHEEHSWGFTMHEIGGIDPTDPATLREMARKFTSTDPTAPRLDELHAHLRDALYHLPEGATIDLARRERMRALWHHAVRQTPPAVRRAAPPGLGVLDVSVPAFDAWLASVTLRWRDDGTPLDPSLANALRLVCQFLAAAYRE